MLEQPMNQALPQCENALVRPISREVDFAWLAGILDGEGALSLGLKTADNGKSYLQVKIRVYNTDVRMIAKISHIYASLGVVFFYNLNRKRAAHWKDQLGICITSQGSCLKVLEAVSAYLVNKREIADVMAQVIRYVTQPKGSGSVARDYVNTTTFSGLMEGLRQAQERHIEPSETIRCANRPLLIR